MQVRADAGLDAAEVSPARATYVNDSIAAISDSLFYGSPAYLQLDSFEERLATVLQATRSPGQPLVYLGSLLLVLGVFAMLYIRERRIWVWLAPRDGATHATMALSTNRKTMDGDREFAQLTEKLIGVAPSPRHGDPA